MLSVLTRSQHTTKRLSLPASNGYGPGAGAILHQHQTGPRSVVNYAKVITLKRTDMALFESI